MAAPRHTDTAAPRGHVVTFYSFKGGTGRTMSLANSACVLAEAERGVGNAVLVVDWDLEAPGLHRYFPPRLRSDAVGNLGLDDQPGLIDLMHALMDALPDVAPESEEEAVLAARRALDGIALERYVMPTDVPGVSILRAGRDDDNGYSRRVNTFNWEALFRRCPVIYRELAEVLAAQWRWTLIDSRTGLTDISGICTALMPEKLVVVFTPNRQSLSGVRDIVLRALEYRLQGSDPRPLLVYPLASRIEASLERLSRDWRRGKPDTGLVGYQPMFEQLLAESNGLPQCSLEAYFDAVFIQQTPDWAYGEVIAVREGSNDRLSLSSSYRVFCDRLMSGKPPWAIDESPAQPAAAAVPAAATTALPTEMDLPAGAAAHDPVVADVLGEVFTQAKAPEPVQQPPASPQPAFERIRVFASFAHSDTARVQPVLEALQERGLAVSSERDLAVGDAYTQVVTRLVDAADVVVVFWSRESVQSQAVEAQVLEGLRRGALLPVLLDDALPPLAFRHVQAMNLRHTGKAALDELAQAVLRLARVRPGDAVPQGVPTTPAWEPPRTAPPPGMATPAPTASGRRLPPFVALGSVIAVAVTVIAFLLGKPGGSATQPGPGPYASAPTQPAQPLITVPDLVTLTTDAAATTAKALGLSVTMLDPDSGVQQGYLDGVVTGQDPAAKSQVPAGGILKLTVSSHSVAVPQVVGGNFGSDTLDKLATVGLVVGKIETVEGTQFKPGTIISQEPAAGARVASGARINLRVAANTVTKLREAQPPNYKKAKAS